MAGTIHLEVASPERMVFEGEVTDLQAPAADGYLGVLPGHAPLITVLGSGVISFVNGDGQRRYLMVQGGLMEILPDRVRAVATFAVWESEVDIERAKKQLDRATDIFHEHDYEADVERATAKAARARAMLDAHERSKAER